MKRGIAVVQMLLLCFSSVSLCQKIDIDSLPRQFEPSHDFDVLHYRIKLRFEEQSKSLFGETEVILRALSRDFARCRLDAETFIVRSVRNNAGRSLKFEQANGSLLVSFPKAFSYGDTLSITVVYDGTNIEVKGDQYGVGKDYALGLGFKEETQENPRLINTLSFPRGARHWFPCYDHPSDKATGEVIATVRSSYSVLSNGRLVRISEDKELSTKTFHWLQDLPHSTYLFVLVAGPYVVIPDSLGRLPVNYWVYPKDVANARRSFCRTPEIIAFFENEYGCRYPLAKYDQITIPVISGGAESTTATVIGEDVIHDERADQDFPSHWLVAHEAAHQWWGNLVTMRDWSETWINESFATYSDYLYSKHDLGEDEGALNLFGKKEQYLAEARDRYRRPIVFDRWKYPNDNFDRHTYQKGALVLHMLRWRMGDDNFRRSTSTFLSKHALKPADTHDLLVAIREATGQVQDEFFDQWIYKAGHPVFQVIHGWDSTHQLVRLKIRQVQETNEWVRIFSTPVDIAVITADGKKTHRVQLSQLEDNIVLPSALKPLLVRFNEGNHLLCEIRVNLSTEEILYQLESDDVIGRIEAVKKLREQANMEAVRAALRRSAEAHPFCGVRREAILALGSAKDPSLAGFFLARISDKKSGVRVAAVRALGELKDSTMAPTFRKLFAQDESYLVQAELLRAVGKCGAFSSLPFLQASALLPSPRRVIQNAAKAAMKELTGR